MGTVAGLAGCFRTVRIVPRTQAPAVYRTASVEVLEKELFDRDAGIQTLNAQVQITASTGGSKEGEVTQYTSFRGYIFVRKPKDLRVILVLPVLGSEAMDMVSDGKKFTLVIPPRKKAITGTNTVSNPSKNGLENLRPAVFLESLLVPGVPTGSFVLRTESTRTILGDGRRKTLIEEPDYDVTIARKKSETLGQTERVLHISRVDMLPFQQDIYDVQGRVVTQAIYSRYTSVNGQMFPMQVEIRRPLDEYTLKVEITKLVLNEKLDRMISLS